MAGITAQIDPNLKPERIDTYKYWQAEQKIPVVRGFFVEDVNTLPLEQWDLKGVPCSMVVLDGTGGGRVLTVGLGLLLGGPLAAWLLTIRDQGLFQLVFIIAFFCLSWYNGPITAVIFDVVPSRISATVAGAYLLFIHLAGDAIALPLVGMLSDQFGLDRAILLLPLVVIGGGVVILGATRTVGRDMARVASSP